MMLRREREPRREARMSAFGLRGWGCGGWKRVRREGVVKPAEGESLVAFPWGLLWGGGLEGGFLWGRGWVLKRVGGGGRGEEER